MSKRNTEGPTRDGLLAYARWLVGNSLRTRDQVLIAHHFVWDIYEKDPDPGRTGGYIVRRNIAESLAYSPWNWTR